MRRNGVKLHMDGLAALLVFGVFAVCVLSVLLTGAGAYRRLAERDRASYERRTGVQYLTARVRQADSLGHVAVETFGGGPALCLWEDGGYVTWVYCHDGWLMELYTSADADLGPEAGERLMEAGGLELSMEDGLLEIVLTEPDGTEETVVLSLRSGEGAAA